MQWAKQRSGERRSGGTTQANDAVAERRSGGTTQANDAVAKRRSDGTKNRELTELATDAHTTRQLARRVPRKRAALVAQARSTLDFDC